MINLEFALLVHYISEGFPNFSQSFSVLGDEIMYQRINHQYWESSSLNLKTIFRGWTFRVCMFTCLPFDDSSPLRILFHNWSCSEFSVCGPFSLVPETPLLDNLAPWSRKTSIDRHFSSLGPHCKSESINSAVIPTLIIQTVHLHICPSARTDQVNKDLHCD